VKPLVPIALALASVSFAVASCTSKPHTSNAADKAAANELLRLLDQGSKQTYHARYLATTPQNTLQLETWRLPPRVRQDSTFADKTAKVHNATFLLPDGIVSCMQQDKAPWTCFKPGGTPKAGDLDPIASQASQLKGQRVAERKTKLHGQEARCFTVQDKKEKSEVCLTLDGITLRLSSGTAITELQSLTRTVTDADFQPLAEPEASAPPP
jgi:hypothetical protein